MTRTALPRPYLLRVTWDRRSRFTNTLSCLLSEIDETSGKQNKREIAKSVFHEIVKFPMFIYKNPMFAKVLQEKMVEFDKKGEHWVRDYAQQLFGANWEDPDMVYDYVQDEVYCYQVV